MVVRYMFAVHLPATLLCVCILLMAEDTGFTVLCLKSVIVALSEEINRYLCSCPNSTMYIVNYVMCCCMQFSSDHIYGL